MKFTPQETESIANICKDLGVANLYLFGSALDASRFNDQSDLDFLVEFNDTQIDGRLARFTGLASALEQLLNRQVDLVSYQAIRNPFFRQEVDSTKTRVFTLDAA